MTQILLHSVIYITKLQTDFSPIFIRVVFFKSLLEYYIYQPSLSTPQRRVPLLRVPKHFLDQNRYLIKITWRKTFFNKKKYLLANQIQTYQSQRTI